MKPAARLLAALCVVFPLALGCSRSDTSTTAARDADIESGRASQASDDEGLRSLAGELRSVHLDTQSFTILAGDELALFEFSDDTQVVGAPSVQGLAANPGSRVTVHYRTHPITSTKTAVRIEME